MKKWKIRGSDGQTITFEGDMPGYMWPNEIIKALQRLASRHLGDQEIVAASLRRNHPSYSPHLESIGHGKPLHVEGGGHFYTAHLE